MVRIRRITTADPLYRQECALREEVLLRPLGLDMDRFLREFPGVEDRLEHFVAVIDHSGRERVVGCVALLPQEGGGQGGRLMQMAVDLQRQGEGIGRRLIVAAEVRAFGELGLNRLFCHAPDGAVGFYEKLGWSAEDGAFEEAGIRHRRVSISHEPASEE
ncbi:MAG: GNAT family N-acetyltransferase [Phycisphaerales bacterium]